jgi:nitrogen fixation/metabolism regulation signal transduction histidine kinase
MMRILGRPFLIGAVVILSLILLVLLAVASANTEFFDEYFAWLYAANLVIGILFLLVIVGLIAGIVIRLRQGHFGTRLIAKLALFFGLVGVLPGAILYGVSLQFVSRSIESWFDVKVESALEAGLNLGRTTIEISRDDLLAKGKQLLNNIEATQKNVGEGGLTLYLSRERQQMGVDELSVFTAGPRLIAGVTSGLNSYVSEISSLDKLKQAKNIGSLVEVEEPNRALDKKTYLVKILLPMRPAQASSLTGFNLRSEADDRYLLIVKEMPLALSENALAVQDAYSEYQEKALGRSGLRKMYIGTLTITLFMALFIAVILALMLGRQLAYPLLMLLKGTQAVAEGDFSQRPEINTGDELGLLTKQFNWMTRQLLEARNSLEESKAFSDSVLSNLTAGVCVLDKNFRLVLANAGASRIFGLDLSNYQGKNLSEIFYLEVFEQEVRQAFANFRTSKGHSELEHWQKQIALSPNASNDQNDEHGVTLLVRGTQLPSGLYIVVFDDISEVLSAQRSIAWGEVARRLAHEIKNPLTPIQLSAERLHQKLSSQLDQGGQEFLERNTQTIISQVQAMKKMVNDFRDFAKTPDANLAPLSVNALVMEILDLYQESQIRSELDPACPQVMADATQIRQILHNLLQNAIDASSEVQGDSAILIETKYLANNQNPEEGGLVRLMIQDCGTGFSSRVLSRAFEPYVTTKAKGTGLGLAMVKKIIDEHHARIELRNRMEGSVVVGAEVVIYFNELVRQS